MLEEYISLMAEVRYYFMYEMEITLLKVVVSPTKYEVKVKAIIVLEKYATNVWLSLDLRLQRKWKVSESVNGADVPASSFEIELTYIQSFFFAINTRPGHR